MFECDYWSLSNWFVMVHFKIDLAPIIIYKKGKSIN